MNGYSYGGGYDANDIDQGNQYGAGDGLMIGPDSVAGGMGGGQSLDEIVNQNAKAIRRQSMPQQYGSDPHQVDADLRRMSMLDYNGASTSGPMNSFGFDPSTSMDQGGMMASASPVRANEQHSRAAQNRRQSTGDLALDTSYGGAAQGYNAMMAPNSAYSTSPAHPQSAIDLRINVPYMDANLGMAMDFNLDPNINHMTGGTMNMHLYNQPQFGPPAMNSPIDAGTQHSTPNATPQSAVRDASESGSGMDSQYGSQNDHSGNHPGSGTLSRAQSMHQMGDVSSPVQASAPMKPPGPAPQPGFRGQPQHPQPASRQDRGMHQQQFDGINGPVPVKSNNYTPNNQGFSWKPAEGGWPSTMVGRPHIQTAYNNAYSATGFDMVGVLTRVATRPHPEINIGAVDFSCAFVVCDAEKDDIPIIHCSENFERLTGYTKHMILGRNCRFLQSPDGNVQSGVRRKYVDDDSVLYLKNMINLRREAQISLINYRRGGQPFMNLLTIIPITWDTEQVKYFVGFQVDLVEQPNAVTNKNPDGSYSVSYQRGMTMPRYVINAPDTSQRAELGQTVPRDDVSAILATVGSGESDYTKRMWDRVLLENTDDVVHVLSLKGLFQWISPSAARVLEYEPSEIIGTALSSVCHPSDIVPVTRELKDTASGASVNVVFRIRRKLSGYMWFEGHGSLHTEQGKGRKSIIMVGRERPVYALSKTEISTAGGIGENELWTKMSTSGMFLFVSSNVRQLLDRQPDDLVGISIQSLMRAESKAEFGRVLEHSRTGKKASVKHEMINRRGQVLSAFTTLYPGDATEGSKPTFIVAQTRLIKFSRGGPPGRPGVYSKAERNSSESVHSAPETSSQVSIGTPQHSEQSTNLSASSNRFVGTDGSAVTFGGQNGLMIGHQDVSLASEENLFDELRTTKSSSWQYEIRQLEKRNRMLAEEVQSLIAAKKKRKRRKNGGNFTKDCANCHTKVTPEWRRGPSGQRDLCNSCGLRWAKLNGRVSPRTSSKHSAQSGGAASDKASKASASPRNPHHAGISAAAPSVLKGGGPQMQPELKAPSQPPARSHGTMPAFEPTVSPRHLATFHEGHAATMEGASGVPDRIEETIEPD